MNLEGKSHFIQSGPYTSDQIKRKLGRDEAKYTDHVWRNVIFNPAGIPSRMPTSAGPWDSPAVR